MTPESGSMLPATVTEPSPRPTPQPPPTATPVPADLALIAPPVLSGIIRQTTKIVGASTRSSLAGDELFAIIDWGDGSVTVAGNIDPDSGVITGEHVYEIPGTFLATVRVISETGSTIDATMVVSVVGSVGGGPSRIVSRIEAVVAPGVTVLIGEVLALQATASVTASSDVLSGFVDWGDGSPREKVEILDSGEVVANHVYSAAGTYFATVDFTAELADPLSFDVTITIQSPGTPVPGVIQAVLLTARNWRPGDK